MQERESEFNFKMKYFEELRKSMNFLGENKNTFFIGQAVRNEGTAMYNTLKDVPLRKRIELPVAEEMQMGISLGMSMNGIIPVSIFPRWNFLLYGMNQLVNHVDKYKIMTKQKKTGKVIIRTAVGSERPLHPQYQHIGDYSESIKKMCMNINIVNLNEANEVFAAYKKAFERDDGISSILVEHGDFYNEK